MGGMGVTHNFENFVAIEQEEELEQRKQETRGEEEPLENADS
jgi:hypothetical protein